MKLKALQYFVAVAREGSITQAASQLYVSQPALSQQLKELERELGAQLLVRTARGVELTEAGRILRRRAEEIIELEQRTINDVASVRGDIGGEVHVGAGACYTAGVLARAAKALAKHSPTTRYHLYDGNSEDFLDRLDRGLLDFCVVYQPIDLSRYDYLRLPGLELWGLVVRPDSPLSEKAVIRRDDLIDEPLILSRQTMREGRLAPSPLAEWIGDLYDRLTIVGTYNLTFNATLFAAEGIGSIVGFEGQIRVNESDRLCFRPFDPPVTNEADVIWKRGKTMPLAAQAYLEALREQIRLEDPTSGA